MKFFSLIHAADIRPSSDKKVIPAAEFSSLLSGKELIEAALADAERYRQEVAKECEALKEKAKQEGFQEGLSSWTKQLAECEHVLQRTKGDVEATIATVAIGAAKKVVGKELEQKPDTLIDIVRQSLKAVAQHKRFVIYVNRQDFALFESNRARLREGLERVESLAIQVKENVAPSTAVIETEAGVINVRLEEIWNALQKAFEALL